jgi:hypothetical protein
MVIMKLATILLFFFFCMNCTLHHYQIGNQPIKLQEASEWKEKKKISFESKYPLEEKSGKDNSIATSYNSGGIRDYLRRGCCIEIQDQAGLHIKYSTKVKDDLMYAPTVFLWMFTLGIIPVFEKIEADVKIEVFDAANQQLLREYNYSINERAYNSWLTIPISLIHFLEDLSAGKFSDSAISQTTKKSITSHSRIAILPIKYQYSKDISVANAIRDKVETVLVNKNYTVVERVKLDEILKELKLSQTGLTTSDQVKIGNMLNASNLILGEVIEVNRNDASLEFSADYHCARRPEFNTKL